jgi:prepilin peptidase CpaA
LSMTIANRVSAVLLMTFTIVAPLTGMEWSAIAWHFAAGGLVLLGAFALFALGGMGGGDAKLLASTAIWMGFGHQLVLYLLVSMMLGGALTLCLLSYRKSPLSVYTGRNLFLRHFADDKVGVPYGIALGIGGLLAYPGSPAMIWAVQRISAS